MPERAGIFGSSASSSACSEVGRRTGGVVAGGLPSCVGACALHAAASAEAARTRANRMSVSSTGGDERVDLERRGERHRAAAIVGAELSAGRFR